MCISEDFKEIGNGMYECVNCGKEVPSGVFNIMNHVDSCEKKKFLNLDWSELSENWDIQSMEGLIKQIVIRKK